MPGRQRAEIVQALERAGVIAIIRMKDPSALRPIVDALMAGGVRALEVTMTVPGAVDLIRALAPSLPADFVLGAGTVTDPDTAERVIEAGARYVVSPVFRTAVIEACHRHDVPALPGCYTPTEILDAWDAGADLVKVFPATTLGPGYLRDVRAPLPQVKLVPTGGVTPDNAGEWIRAGAAAVGIGSALLDTAAIATGNFAVLTDKARRAIAGVALARESR
jgi:2-dehydro-3-deoxyphosphogluconate aldolase/(4S)-4-hydroxy-2-oxoglutarate aldolase